MNRLKLLTIGFNQLMDEIISWFFISLEKDITQIMAGIHFKEVQKVNLSWKWIFLIGLYVLMFWALIEQFKTEVDVSAVTSITFSICLIALFNVIIIIMELETEIDESKIRFRYRPFHVKPRIIYWDEVAEFKIREYKSYKEYGGHGLKRKLRNGRAFTVSGKKGLQLILKNGRKILIGTQKPKELELIIEKIKKQN